MKHILNSIISNIASRNVGNANARRCYRTALVMTSSALLLLSSMSSSAQSLQEVEPMGEWAEYITVQFDGKPLLVHLRTGYERAVIFPEPVSLHSVNDIAVSASNFADLPNCKIEIDREVVGFAPLKRFKQTRVSVRGTNTGVIYKLVVSSSPTGRRQPIQISK